MVNNFVKLTYHPAHTRSHRQEVPMRRSLTTLVATFALASVGSAAAAPTDVLDEVRVAVAVTEDGATIAALAAAGVTVDDVIAVAVDGDTAVVLTRPRRRQGRPPPRRTRPGRRPAAPHRCGSPLGAACHG